MTRETFKNISNETAPARNNLAFFSVTTYVAGKKSTQLKTFVDAPDQFGFSLEHPNQVMVDGEWVDVPSIVYDDILKCYGAWIDTSHGALHGICHDCVYRENPCQNMSHCIPDGYDICCLNKKTVYLKTELK